eukprot:scaffold358_cov256-Pinguiococcus_pyrenoidosus.AAC.14
MQRRTSHRALLGLPQAVIALLSPSQEAPTPTGIPSPVPSCCIATSLPSRAYNRMACVVASTMFLLRSTLSEMNALPFPQAS